jgi:hypothetical protein
MANPDATSKLDADMTFALSQLDVSISEAKHHNDPLWMPLSALSAHIQAQRQLHANFVASMTKSIEDARQPVRGEDMRRAVVQGIGIHAAATVRTMGWRNVLIGAGLLLGAAIIGAGSGYWMGTSAEAAKYVQAPANLGVALTASDAAEWVNLIRLNNITQANRTCFNQGGGIACSFALWTKSPLAKSNQ